LDVGIHLLLLKYLDKVACLTLDPTNSTSGGSWHGFTTSRLCK
jgi:hypothetical protein